MTSAAVCKSCGKDKPLDAFQVTKSKGEPYRMKRCKACEHAKTARWRAENPDKVLAWNNSSRRRAIQLRLRGAVVTEAEIEELWKIKQCQICGKKLIGRDRQTDHDHKTGELRSMLCGNCNNGLGRFMDSPVLLDAAAAYLRSFRSSKAAGETG